MLLQLRAYIHANDDIEDAQKHAQRRVKYIELTLLFSERCNRQTREHLCPLQ